MNRLAPEIMLFTLILAVLILASIFGYFAGGVDIRSGSAGRFSVSAEESLESGWIISRFAIIFLVSCLIFDKLFRRQTFESTIIRSSPGSRRSLEHILGRRSVDTVAMALILYVALLLPIVGRDMLSRETYLFMTAGSFSALMGTVSLPVALVAATLAIGSQRRWLQLASWSILLLLITFELTKASRAAAGIAVFTGIVFYLLSRTSLFTRILAFFAFLSASALLLVSVLQFRGNKDGHGLIPYWHMFSTGKLTLDASRWESAFSNLMATVPITYLSSRKAVPDGYTLISLSPFSGEAAGWYEVASSQVLFWAVPTNAYGQIAAMSPFQGVVCTILIATIISVTAIVRSYAPANVRLPLLFIASAMTMLTAIMFMQYSIRSGSRWLWLALGLTLVITMTLRLFEDRRAIWIHSRTHDQWNAAHVAPNVSPRR